MKLPQDKKKLFYSYKTLEKMELEDILPCGRIQGLCFFFAEPTVLYFEELFFIFQVLRKNRRVDMIKTHFSDIGRELINY